MHLVVVGPTEAYWSSSVQVAIVLALALVVELRFVARRWTVQNSGLRRYYGAVWLLGAIAVGLAVTTPLQVLEFGTYDPWQLDAEPILLNTSLGLVALSPALDIVFAAYLDGIIKLWNRFPFTKFGRSRSGTLRRIKQSKRTLARVDRMRETSADELARMKVVIRVSGRAVKALGDSLKDSDLTDEQRATNTSALAEGKALLAEGKALLRKAEDARNELVEVQGDIERTGVGLRRAMVKLNRYERALIIGVAEGALEFVLGRKPESPNR